MTNNNSTLVKMKVKFPYEFLYGYCISMILSTIYLAKATFINENENNIHVTYDDPSKL